MKIGIQNNFAKETKKALEQGISKDKIKKALFLTGIKIIAESEKHVAVLEGFLLGSNSVTVSGMTPFSAQTTDGKTPSGALPPEVDGMQELELRVGYNMPYAWEVHEDLLKFPGEKSVQKGLPYEAGGRAKYLTKTLDERNWVEVFTDILEELNEK